VRAQAVARDLGADVLLGERQPRAAVAGADHVALDHVHIERRIDRRATERGGASRAARRRRPQRRHPGAARQSARRTVLDLDDRLVVQVQQVSKRMPGIARHFLTDLHEAAAGQVAEEVDLALRVGANSLSASSSRRRGRLRSERTFPRPLKLELRQVAMQVCSRSPSCSTNCSRGSSRQAGEDLVHRPATAGTFSSSRRIRLRRHR
jgi:hypothetical protein